MLQQHPVPHCPVVSGGGLHEGHREWQRQHQTCHSCSPTAVLAGLSRDAVVEETAKGILNSLPRAWDMPSVRKGLGGVISPTEVVLLQELERYNQACSNFFCPLERLSWHQQSDNIFMCPHCTQKHQLAAHDIAG